MAAMALLSSGEYGGSGDYLDAEAIGRSIAVVRVLFGAALLAATRPLLRGALRGTEPSPETVGAIRMVGGRDLALGIGGLLAARRGPQRLRGWVEAGMLADAIDVPSLAGSTSLRPLVRLAGSASAAVAAGVGGVVARRLA
jgi:hypothetical protein